MRIRKEKKIEGEQLAMEEVKKGRGPTSPRLRGVKDEGPKWVSAALLIITILISLGFWLQGTGGVGKAWQRLAEWAGNWESKKVYVIE